MEKRKTFENLKLSNYKHVHMDYRLLRLRGMIITNMLIFISNGITGETIMSNFTLKSTGQKK